MGLLKVSNAQRARFEPVLITVCRCRQLCGLGPAFFLRGSRAGRKLVRIAPARRDGTHQVWVVEDHLRRAFHWHWCSRSQIVLRRQIGLEA